MNITLDEFSEEAKKLSLSEKAKLIERLIQSLEELDESECEKLWLEEANRRYDAYKKGKILSKSSKEVFKKQLLCNSPLEYFYMIFRL